MKPHKKTTKVTESEVPVHVGLTKKKATTKPWRLEYMIIDEQKARENSFSRNPLKANVWLEDTWEKFMSVDHGLQQLNKQGRSSMINKSSFFDHWKFAGKKFRLVNIDTKEIVNLIIKDNEICCIES